MENATIGNKGKVDILDSLKKNEKITDKVRSSDYSHNGKLHTEKSTSMGSSIVNVKAPNPIKSVGVVQSQSEEESASTTRKSLDINSHGEIPKIQISRSTIESYANRTLGMNDIKYVANEIVRKSQDVLTSGKDDLGVQTMGMTITASRTGIEMAKAYSKTIEAVEPMMGKATIAVTKGVAKTTINLAKQTGLTAYSIGMTYNVVKGTNTNIISKDTWNLFKSSAQLSGLSQTQISQTVTKCVDSTISAVKSAYNGVKAVKEGAKTVYNGTKTVITGTALASYTIAKSFDIIKANNTFPLSKSAFETLKITAVSTGLTNHQLYKSIEAGTNAVKDGVVNTAKNIKEGTINTAKNVKEGVVNTAKNIKEGAVNTAKTVVVISKSGVQTVKQTINVVKGVANGTIPIKTVAKSVGVTVGKGVLKGVKITAKGGLSATKFLMPYAGGLLKFGGKFGVKTAKVGIKVGSKVNLSLADALSGTDDLALQGLGATMRAGDMAVRLSRGAIKTSFQVGKGVGKVGIKTAKVGRGVVGGVKGMWETYKKTNSLMQSLKYAGKMGGKAIAVAFKNEIVNIT